MYIDVNFIPRDPNSTSFYTVGREILAISVRLIQDEYVNILVSKRFLYEFLFYFCHVRNIEV